MHVPTGEEMRVFEACARYNPQHRRGVVDTPLLVIAGKDFGKGTTREWAVKGQLEEKEKEKKREK